VMRERFQRTSVMSDEIEKNFVLFRIRDVSHHLSRITAVQNKLDFG
jgi:hypothetical protein